MKQTEPFAAMPQEVLYSDKLDDLDIRLLLHFYGTYRLKGQNEGPFEYSVPALQTVFPKWKSQVYRRKVAIYVKAGVLVFSRYKTIHSKRIPFYHFQPSAVTTLCGLNRPHSEAALCGPGRPHSESGSCYAVPVDHIRSKEEESEKEDINNVLCTYSGKNPVDGKLSVNTNLSGSGLNSFPTTSSYLAPPIQIPDDNWWDEFEKEIERNRQRN